MNTKILEKIGLTKNQIAVYIALLELGSSTTGPITKSSRLHSSRVYESKQKSCQKEISSQSSQN